MKEGNRMLVVIDKKQKRHSSPNNNVRNEADKNSPKQGENPAQRPFKKVRHTISPFLPIITVAAYIYLLVETLRTPGLFWEWTWGSLISAPLIVIDNIVHAQDMHLHDNIAWAGLAIIGCLPLTHAIYLWGFTLSGLSQPH